MVPYPKPMVVSNLPQHAIDRTMIIVWTSQTELNCSTNWSVYPALPWLNRLIVRITDRRESHRRETHRIRKHKDNSRRDSTRSMDRDSKRTGPKNRQRRQSGHRSRDGGIDPRESRRHESH